MERKKHLTLLLVFVISQMLFSCNTAKHSDFSKRKYLDGIFVNKKVSPEKMSLYLHADDQQVTGEYSENNQPASDRLEASIDSKNPQDFENPEGLVENIEKIKDEPGVKELKQKMSRKGLKRILKNRIRANIDNLKRNDPKGARHAAPDEIDPVVLILIAIFVPPLAVYLYQEKEITDYFWIDLLLSLFFLIPGIVFAILVIRDTI